MSDLPATVTCPACGDTHPSPDGDPDFLVKGISQCSVCQTRIVYGEPAARIVVEPGAFESSTETDPRPSITLRIQHPITKGDLLPLQLDPQHAFMVAKAIISLVRP